MTTKFTAATVLAVATAAGSAQFLLAEITFDGDQSTTTGFDTTTPIGPTNEVRGTNPDPALQFTFDAEITGTGFVGDATDGQLGWATFLEEDFLDSSPEPTPLDGSSDTFDAMGVLAGVGVGGSNAYQWDDTDSFVTLRTDWVDTMGFDEVFVTFDIFTAGTYEESSRSQDGISITLDEEGVIGSAGESLFEGDGFVGSGVFETLTLRFTSPLDGRVRVDFQQISSGAGETMIIDNIRFFGVPTPGAAAVFGVAGLAAARRRR